MDWLPVNEAQTRMPRVLLLPMAGMQHGSSRLRAYQYVPHLEAAGMRVNVLNRTVFSTQVHYALAVIRAVAAADVVFVQKRFMPNWFYAVCRCLGRPVVYDFDDALQCLRDGQPSPNRMRFHRSLRNADHVVAGNRTIAQYAAKYNDSVTVIPTPVGTHRMRVHVHQAGQFVVGWIGSPDAIADLRLAEGALRRVAASIAGLRLRVICSRPVAFEGIPTENIPWSLETSEARLCEVDVGIMPVPDNDYGRGKCAYKALQCMSLGVPVVVSPVGMNREIVTHGVSGFWARAEDDWVNALLTLSASPDLVASMGIAAHATAQQYTLPLCAGKLVSVLRSVFGTGSHP